MMKRTVIALTAMIAMGSALHPALAADWFVRAGVAHVSPQSDTGDLATLQSSITDNTQLGLTVGYHINPNLAVELLASTPFTHQVSLKGLGRVGEVSHLPPTLTLQYYFNPEGKFSPFVGGGVNYTWTYDEKSQGALSGTNLDVGNSLGVAVQAGLRVALAEGWDLVADVRWMDIDAEVKVNGARVGTAKVDPMVYSLMVGKRF